MEMLADNKTCVGTTDDNRKLEIDPETLETRELIKWEDDEYCITGVSHSKRMPDGTYYSICNHLDFNTMKMSIMLFKLEGENTFKRIRIAQIPQDKSSMQHAFAMTNEYAIIFDPPWYLQQDFYSMMFKSSDMLDMIK